MNLCFRTFLTVYYIVNRLSKCTSETKYNFFCSIQSKQEDNAGILGLNIGKKNKPFNRPISSSINNLSGKPVHWAPIRVPTY